MRSAPSTRADRTDTEGPPDRPPCDRPRRRTHGRRPAPDRRRRSRLRSRSPRSPSRRVGNPCAAPSRSSASTAKLASFSMTTRRPVSRSPIRTLQSTPCPWGRLGANRNRPKRSTMPGAPTPIGGAPTVDPADPADPADVDPVPTAASSCATTSTTALATSTPLSRPAPLGVATRASATTVLAASSAMPSTFVPPMSTPNATPAPADESASGIMPKTRPVPSAPAWPST